MGGVVVLFVRATLVGARRRQQHARRVRSPERAPDRNESV